MEGGERDRKKERWISRSPNMTASSDNDVSVRERERKKKDKEREEIVLSGCSGVVSLSCKALCCCLSSSSLSFSLSLSLVSSALLSSRLMEQSMQIAWVNRARDSREERRGGGAITPASSVSPQLLPSAGMLHRCCYNVRLDLL